MLSARNMFTLLKAVMCTLHIPLIDFILTGMWQLCVCNRAEYANKKTLHALVAILQ